MTKILMRKEIDCNVIRLQFIELMKLTGRPHAVHEKQVLVFFVTFVPPVEEVFVGWLLYVFRAISEIKRVDLDRAKLEVFPFQRCAGCQLSLKLKKQRFDLSPKIKAHSEYEGGPRETR